MNLADTPKIEKPWGYEIILSADGFPVCAKILFIKAGSRFSLQYHDGKDEVLTLYQGKAELSIGQSGDQLDKIEMKELVGYSIRRGMVHRVQAIEDAYIFEASTPEAGTTFRLEDDFSRGDEKR